MILFELLGTRITLLILEIEIFYRGIDKFQNINSSHEAFGKMSKRSPNECSRNRYLPVHPRASITVNHRSLTRSQLRPLIFQDLVHLIPGISRKRDIHFCIRGETTPRSEPLRILSPFPCPRRVRDIYIFPLFTRFLLVAIDGKPAARR